MTDPMLPITLTVAATRRETADTVTLRINRGFAFRPGQFNMLYAFGVGEAAISMSGDPTERDTLVHTIRRVGAITGALARLRKGDAIGVRGPFGRGWPIEAALGQDVLVIAGGLGLPPLRPLVYDLLRRRREVGRIAILVGARTPADLLYPGEHARWEEAGAQVLVTVDRAGPEWKLGVGVVTALLPRAAVDAARAVAYVCGPEIMMRFTARELVGLGVDERRIFLSMERNMKCAIGLCGHCLLGPAFVCKDGPVFDWPRLRPLLITREL
jgi:NAD(P)H-flavin reductase